MLDNHHNVLVMVGDLPSAHAPEGETDDALDDDAYAAFVSDVAEAVIGKLSELRA